MAGWLLAAAVAGAGDRIDINTATPEQFATLPGIGPVLAARIVEHRDRHGGFNQPEELMNVFGVGPKRFEAIRDRITVTAPDRASPSLRPEPTPYRVNINTATSLELQTLPGIGPVRAQRIIEYREKHRRFSRVDQLQEVYGIGAKTFESLREMVTVRDESKRPAAARSTPFIPPAGPTALRCWRCAHTFEVDLSRESSGNCSACGARWETRR